MMTNTGTRISAEMYRRVRPLGFGGHFYPESLLTKFFHSRATNITT
jgi:hypothetical protein